jgi:hypothetical protein
MKACGTEPSSEWTLQSGDIMHAIFLEFLQQQESMQNEFRRIRNEAGGRPVKFFAVSLGPCRVWHCGLRANSIPTFGDVTLPGNNLYGHIVSLAYRSWLIKEEHDHSKWPCRIEPLLQSRLIHPSSRKTLALVSDSNFRQGKSVFGGDILVQPGATCGELGQMLSELGFSIQDYHAAIFCVSTNDSLLDGSLRLESYKTLREILMPVHVDSTVDVIFNVGLHLPKWRKLPQYTEWLLTQLSNDFGNLPNFAIFDWSYLSPIMLDDPYYWADSGHLNQHGLRRMRHAWCKKYGYLRTVSIEWTTAHSKTEKWKYPLGTLSDKLKAKYQKEIADIDHQLSHRNVVLR